MPVLCISDGIGSDYYEVLQRITELRSDILILGHYETTSELTSFDTKEFIKNFEITVPSDIVIEKMQSTFQEKHQDLKSGKIRRLWDDYHGIWIIWTPPVAHKPRKIFNKIFIRRFRGNNRGRHWNRRR